MNWQQKSLDRESLMRSPSPLPARIGPVEFGELGRMVIRALKAATDPLFEVAPVSWTPAHLCWRCP